MSEKLYVHYRDEAESFESIGLYDDSPMTVGGLDRPLRVQGARLAPSLFGMLGARPLEGRLFADRLRDAGVPVRYDDHPGLVHGFVSMTGGVAAARRAVDEMAAILREAVR